MPSGQSDHWYAVRVKSNRERITAEALKGKGFPVCVPYYRDRSNKANSPQTVEHRFFGDMCSAASTSPSGCRF